LIILLSIMSTIDLIVLDVKIHFFDKINSLL
jgi:hypothetical protein